MSARNVFRFLAFAEAVSWAGLLIGMLFKYVISDNPTGVHIFGPIHGAVFVLYVLGVIALFRHFRWGFWTTMFALAASIPPFATVLFEWWVDRRGMLGRPHHDAGTTRETLRVPTS